MADYTVVGVYDDNGQPYCDHYDAETPLAAVKIALLDSESPSLVILCAFQGLHNDLLPVSDGYDIGWAETCDDDG